MGKRAAPFESSAVRAAARSRGLAANRSQPAIANSTKIGTSLVRIPENPARGRRYNPAANAPLSEIDQNMFRRQFVQTVTLLLSLVGTSAAWDEQPKLNSVQPDANRQKLNWQQVTSAAAWQPRDSQGEVVYHDRLWIFGGWFNSYESPPRDVWSSPDGKNWTRVTASAPWKHSDLAMTVVHDDKMWLMGGWYNGRLPGHEASHEVWSSVDGANWTPATRAPAGPRGWRPASSPSRAACGFWAEPKTTTSATRRA